MQLVDKTSQDFTFEFQQRLSHAIVSLNKEVMAVQEQQLSGMRVEERSRVDNLLSDLETDYQKQLEQISQRNFRVRD